MDTDNDQIRPPSNESIQAGYEESVVPLKGLIIFGVGLIVTAVIVHAGIWFLLKGFDRFRAAELSRQTSAVESGRLPPPTPRLQPNPADPQRIPAADLQAMFENEDRLFDQMGWRIDPQTHVPLEIPARVLDAVISRSQGGQGQERASANVRDEGENR